MRLINQLAAVVCVISALSSCVAPPLPVQQDRLVAHPQAGKFKASRDPDHPILAFYGGVGLRKMPDGRWNGYDQQSPEDVRYLISRMRENGMTRIYASFQEEQYPSKVIPRESKGTDYVDLFIKQAHENNIEVYGDIACFANVEATCHNFTTSHPASFTRDVSGALDSHMLSPAHEDVRQFKRSLIREYIANYPVDGIALDFIRYPYYTKDIRVGFGKHGYDEPALRSFRERFGYDSSYQPAVNDPRWIKVKSEFVSRFIHEVREDIRNAGLNLPIATFNSITYGTADSLRTVHQDAQAWQEQGLVDESAPMLLMTIGMNNLCRATEDLLKVRRPGAMVMGAIFLDAGFDPSRGFAPTPAMIKDAARRLIKLRCDGIWFCRASEIEQYELWPTVKEISQWSIQQIRSEDFDPFFENLFDADDWTSLRPEQPPFKLPVRIELSQAESVVFDRAVQFVTTPHLGVYALTFDAHFQGDALEAPARLELQLQYEDGTRETHSMESTSQHVILSVKPACDFDRRVLKHARARVIAPRGSGSIVLQQATLQRDVWNSAAR